MKILKIIVCFGLLSLAFSCKKEKTDIFDVVYDIEFVATWSATTHPTDFPVNAHFSPFMVFSHSNAVNIVTEGLVATEGVKQLAETGATDILEGELEVLQNVSLVLDIIKGERVDSPGSNTQQIGVSTGFSNVSVLSMIAPSPDWFVAATTTLIDPNDGLWYDEVIVNVQTYDAGTDSGTTFTSPDEISDPVGTIELINDGALVEEDTIVENMGYFVFRRVQ